ncbi:MAG: alpha-glucosidase [Oscillospiraceae bacterium]|nr:alpha-glucosidase [Oscillospiraceae bacterium]
MAAKNLHRDTVVYQIYPRSFADSNGDGIGDIPGIISKLDYIADLGVNTIWLSPVYKSPDDDNGYDIADYKSIHPQYGTMEDFDNLLAQAKARGIGIVMDLVINHTSDEHEWFQKALAGDKKYRDYYIIRKGKNGRVPNNWGNFFAECPWTKFGGEDSDEYYLHLFSKKQPDLNWHNPAVLEEVKDIMRFWLEKGVVGFRCDVINVIYKDSLENGKPSPILTGLEHYHSTEGCHRILRTLHDEVLEPYGAFTVGETVFVDVFKARDLIDESRRELDMIFYFEHMEIDQVIVKWFKTKLVPQKLMKCLSKWQLALDWSAVYFENHDQPRFISRFSDSKGFRVQCSKMMAGLLMTLRGTPFVFEGQEIGMTNGDFKNLDEIQDIESHNVYKMATNLHLPKRYRWKMIQRTSRDNARTPMQWTNDANAGFTTGKPWLKVNGNYHNVNVDRDMADPDGVRAFWKKMIELRKTNNILCNGSFRSCVESKSVYAFRRVLDGEELLSVCNMTSKAVALPEKIKGWNNIVVSSYSDCEQDVLKPFEFRLVKKD